MLNQISRSKGILNDSVRSDYALEQSSRRSRIGIRSSVEWIASGAAASATLRAKAGHPRLPLFAVHRPDWSSNLLMPPGVSAPTSASPSPHLFQCGYACALMLWPRSNRYAALAVYSGGSSHLRCLAALHRLRWNEVHDSFRGLRKAAWLPHRPSNGDRLKGHVPTCVSGGACCQTPPDTHVLRCRGAAYFGDSTISIWRPSMRG